jgi:hypothetical protein
VIGHAPHKEKAPVAAGAFEVCFIPKKVHFI